MPVRILKAAAAEDLLRATQTWVSTLDQPTEVLVLATSAGPANDFVRRCSSLQSGLFGYHRLTLPQLASELAVPALARSAQSLLTQLGMYALVVRVAYRALHDQSLTYFQPVADMPGFASALTRTLGEMRMEGIPPARLANTNRSGQDLAGLLEAYHQELETGRLADRAGMYRAAAEVLKLGTSRFAGIPVVMLGVSPGSQVERDFLSILGSQTPHLFATLLEGDREGIEALQTALSVAAEPIHLTDLGEQPGPTGPTTRLSRLRERLFSTSRDKEEILQEDTTLDFFSAPGEGRECVEIARRIRLAAEQGTPFDQMVIALRSPELYYPLVEDALRRAGIPGYFTRGTKRPDPAGRAFLALLECASEGLSASRFAEYLSLGQVPQPDETGAPKPKKIEWVEPQDGQLTFKTPATTTESEQESDPQDSGDGPVLEGELRVPAKWEQMLVEAAVIGGRDRWERRLNGLVEECKLQLNDLQDEEVERRNIERKLGNLAHLKNFAIPLIRFLDEMNHPALWSEWIDTLGELAGEALREPHTVLAVLSELSPMGEVGPVTLEEVRGVLADRLAQLRSPTPANRYGRVLVATIDELAVRSFDLVFLPGVAEGIFPRKPTEDPLLLDRERGKIGVRSWLDSLRFRERLSLRTAVGTARQSLVVSYPRIDASQNRSRVPSFYALDILRAAEGRLPDVRELEKRAARASMTRLGWPAPEDAGTAIDDAEYDLALLDPLLQLRPSETRGEASFLLEVNAPLARSLRTRARRWKNFFSSADGLVQPDKETLELLQKERLRARSYSPTALQQFSACPYRFLLYSILRLRTREEMAPLEQMDPLTRGGLFHQFQFELLTALRDLGLLPISEANLEEVSSLAEEIMTRVSDNYRETLSPAVPRIWDSEIDGLRTDMKGWLQAVAASDKDWIPIRFEYSFGLPLDRERDTDSTVEEAKVFNGIRLKGSIDLVERNAHTGNLRVTDHKTGRAGEASLIVKGGEVLQPLLYGLAAEQLLGIPAEQGQLFFCTRRGDFQRTKVPIDSGTCDKFKVVLETIDRALEKGFLPAAPRENACTYCDYRSVCGPYEEMRIKRKLPDELKDLLQLRSLP